MVHKLTFDGLAAEVARTSFALPEADWNEPEPAPRKVLGWFVPAHIRAVTGKGTITLQCEHGHAEGVPERRLDGPRFNDPHVGAFLRAHAHGSEITGYRP